MSLVDQEKYIRPSVTRETGYESVYFEVIKTRHIIRNSTPRFTKPDCLVLIRPILNKIQPIKSSKEFETNVELPAIYPLHCILSFYCYMYNFQKFWMAVFCSKSGLIKRKLLNFVKINVHVSTLYLMCSSSQNPQFQTLEKTNSRIPNEFHQPQTQNLNSNVPKSTNPKF